MERSSGRAFLIPLKMSSFTFLIEFYKNIYNNYVKPRTKPSRMSVNHDHETFDSFSSLLRKSIWGK